MKIKIFLLIVISATILNSYAQDSLFLVNKNNIKAKVLEVSDVYIRYKLFDFQDGPIYAVKRNEIHFIKYSNGMVETMNNKKDIAPNKNKVNDVDTTFRRLLFGGGFNVGVFNPKDFYDYVQKYADYYNLTVDHSFDNVYIGIRAFVGYRVTTTFDVNISGELCTSFKDAYDNNNYGDMFSYTKTSFGIVVNKRVPIIRKLGINILGGVMYNTIEVSTSKETLYSGNGLGFKLQGGINFYATKLFTLQGLIGGEYAYASDKGLNMDYSGLIFTINAIFNK